MIWVNVGLDARCCYRSKPQDHKEITMQTRLLLRLNNSAPKADYRLPGIDGLTLLA